MSAATADKPKATGRKKGAAEANGSASIEDAHKALGTDANLDLGPQDVHDGDELREPDEAPESASGAPVQLSFGMAGKKPTTSGLRLTGGKLDIEQQFSKGQTVVLHIEAVIGEVAFIDQIDSSTGQVVGCERRHKARVVGCSVA